jgi:hypothetical protein
MVLGQLVGFYSLSGDKFGDVLGKALELGRPQ